MSGDEGAVDAGDLLDGGVYGILTDWRMLLKMEYVSNYGSIGMLRTDSCTASALWGLWRGRNEAVGKKVSECSPKPPQSPVAAGGRSGSRVARARRSGW
jgi:hypothetical protein